MRWACVAILLSALPLLAQAPADRPVAPADVYLQVWTDLERMVPTLRTWTRYLTLYNVYNINPAECEKVKKVLDGHDNGLSSYPKIKFLTVVPGTKGTLLRLDLRDYYWSSMVWGELKHREVYFHVKATEKGKTLLVQAPWLVETDEAKAKLVDIFKWTETKTPVVRGDWFLNQTAIQEGRDGTGYYDFLNVKNQKDWEKLIRFDEVLAKGLEQRRVIPFSGITLHLRRAEMTNTVLGKLLRTFDNRNAVDNGNPLRVLDNSFTFVATEQFAPLPNGLPAWLLANDKGVLQKKAPDDVVGGDRFGGGNDTRLHVNLSCIRCHGQGKEENYIKDMQEAKINKFGSVDYAKKLELESQYLRNIVPHITAERSNYSAAVKEATGGWTVQEYAGYYQNVFSGYEDGKINPEGAAAEFGTTEKVLVKAFKEYEKTVGTIDPVLSILMNGGQVPREQFEEAYALGQAALRGYQLPLE